MNRKRLSLALVKHKVGLQPYHEHFRRIGMTQHTINTLCWNDTKIHVGMRRAYVKSVLSRSIQTRALFSFKQSKRKTGNQGSVSRIIV